MASLLNSAMRYFNTTGGADRCDEFVNQCIEVGQQSFRIKRFIAKGGFAFVFEATETKTGRDYAIKRLLANEKSKCKAILQEIALLKRLSGHPNIVDFVAAATSEKEGMTEYLVVTEFCPGDLVKILEARWPMKPLFPDQVTLIFYQACAAVEYLHTRSPPVVHRDLKLQNLLVSAQHTIKLCDFGSCTTKLHYPDTSWSAGQRATVQDEVTENTTPQYRAPEALDLYQNLPLDAGMDKWALGCLLYVLCYQQHPFEDGARLAILNAAYRMPQDDTTYAHLQPVIRDLLVVNPLQRPDLSQLLSHLETLVSPGIDPKGPVQGLLPGNPAPRVAQQPPPPPQQQQQQQPPARPPPPPRPAAPPGQAGAGAAAAGPGGSVLSSFMGRIRDVGSRVTETVAAMSREGLDLHYLTSRLAVMSYPAEGLESAYRNHYEDVRAFLDSRHPRAYAVYNLSTRRYPQSRFEGRVSEVGWEAGTAPPLASLFAILRNMQLWLRQGPHTICVLHCLDGKASSALVSAATCCFLRLFPSPRHGLELFAARRCPPNISPSQRRYADYTAEMAADPPRLPHRRPVMLVTLTLTPVPMFNRQRRGCTPYAEVWANGERVLSTCPESYEAMRPALVEDGQVRLGLNISVCGDVTISVFHARSTLGGKMQGRISSMKICQVQFHTGFVREDFDRLNFTKCELDFLDTDDKYSSDFKLSLDLVVSPQDKPLVDGPPPWDGFQARGLKPRLLVSEDEELAKLRADFMRDGEAPPLASPVSSQDSPLADNEPAAPAAAAAAAAAPPKPQREGGSSFFDTLDWQHLEEPAPSAQPPISEPQQQRDEGPRDYEAEALRAAHREAERDRAEAEAERRRRLSGGGGGGGSGNFCPPEEPHRQADLEQSAALNDVSAGVADLLGFGGGGGGGGGSNGGLSPAASSASLRQTQSNADLLSDLFSSAPAPAAASAGTTATPPPKAPYVVDDFFGGPNFTRKEPRSLHEMRHQARAQSMDPERAKVEAWVAGKERNVRGLLCSLHTVVWEGCRWTQVSMADLVSGDQVKKVYRKACLAVHPDKWAGTQHEAFSKLVFVELNDAWSAFEESGMKSLY
uniref:Auxilin n=1 Tax=Macrostomum lignano TaxID=282301 RepID=A0A1I8GP70_9PLAT